MKLIIGVTDPEEPILKVEVGSDGECGTTSHSLGGTKF